MALLIYKFNCNRCNYIYVGKTTRHLAVQNSKHIGVSYRTLLLLTWPSFRVIREHLTIFDHDQYSITPEIFKIISQGQNNLEILTKESLLVKHLQPNLNNVVFCFSYFCVFFIFSYIYRIYGELNNFLLFHITLLIFS